ncbi:hypothetical protein FRC09_018276, partial [Ceratobasidium sp. 395]
MSHSEGIEPFSISVSDQQLDELSTKLNLTHLPDELDLPAGHEWDWGIPLAVLKPVVDYWRTQYNWRAVEEKLNRTLPQFTTEIDTPGHGSQRIHFVHKRSDNPLPGFAFSQRASAPGMGAQMTAQVFDKLMAKLGYKHYIAQGGDWGALVCRGFAVYHQDSCLGTHQNYWFSGAPTFTQNPLISLKVVLGKYGLPGGYHRHDIEGIKAGMEF